MDKELSAKEPGTFISDHIEENLHLDDHVGAIIGNRLKPINNGVKPDLLINIDS